MNDYDVNHRTIDAILEHSFKYKLADMYKLKINEIFNNNNYYDLLYSKSEVVLYQNGTTEFVKKLKSICTNQSYIEKVLSN